MDTGYTIRAARPAELDRLVALMLALQDHLEASNPDLWQMKVDTRDQIRGQLAARLTAPNSCVVVAEHEQDGVIGAAFGRIVTNSRYIPDRAGVVDQTFVHSDHRRAGVGSALVAELCRFFSSHGVSDLSLRYVVGNEQAAGFWEALGFSPRIVTVGAQLQLVRARLGLEADS
jgi:GNAT superfamily N-acetyltransferase